MSLLVHYTDWMTTEVRISSSILCAQEISLHSISLFAKDFFALPRDSIHLEFNLIHFRYDSIHISCDLIQNKCDLISFTWYKSSVIVILFNFYHIFAGFSSFLKSFQMKRVKWLCLFLLHQYLCINFITISATLNNGLDFSIHIYIYI